MFKHHSVLIAFIFFCTASFPQAYLPLIEEGKKWSEYCYFYPTEQWTDFYYIGNDTIVNDSLYYQLSFDSNYPNVSYSMIGYLKETIQGQVYYFPVNIVDNLSFTEEYLLYDFNSEPGDTLEVYEYDGGTCLIMIDSIISEVYYNIVRNKYYYHNLEGASESTFIIEGIGSSLGLLNTSRFNLDDGSYLLCVTKDTTLLYFNTEVWNSCEAPTTVFINEQFPDDFPSIFPNPNDGIFKLFCPQVEEFELRIYDKYGVLLVKQNITSNAVINLNRYFATSGLYIYLILKDNQIVKSGKMIID